MAIYKVEITEILQKPIEVNASSREAAEKIVKERYNLEEIVLSSEDCVETNIQVIGKVKNRDNRER